MSIIEKNYQEIQPDIIYEPSSRWSFPNFKEIWQNKELLIFLTWRDIKVRYKQSAIGIGWVILQPLLTMAIFSIIFGRLAKLPSGGVPYPVFSFVALLPWQLFASSLTRSGNSLVGNSNLITKIYFPRLILPIAAILAGLVDFAISLLVLIALMLVYGIAPTFKILYLPLLILLAILTALAVGLWLAAINVKYRDVTYALPFIVQIWMYASPVAYSPELIPEGFGRIIYSLNPMAGVIQGFRWALLGTQPPDEMILLSTIVVVVLLVSGLLFFKKMELTFADVI